MVLQTCRVFNWGVKFEALKAVYFSHHFRHRARNPIFGKNRISLLRSQSDLFQKSEIDSTYWYKTRVKNNWQNYARFNTPVYPVQQKLNVVDGWACCGLT